MDIKKFASLGGQASAASLSPEKRKARAQAAAFVRWANWRKKKAAEAAL